MKHRNWARFLGLTAASAASLCLGAFLSYQAAMEQQAADPAAPAQAASAQQDVLAGEPVSATRDAAPVPAQREAEVQSQPAVVPPSPPRGPIIASLESEALPVFSPANTLAAPLDLRMSDDADVIEAALQGSDLATPTNPAELPAAPEQPVADALFHGKPAPLPPVRPTSLNAAEAPPMVEAAVRPATGNLPAIPPIPGQGLAPTLSAPSPAQAVHAGSPTASPLATVAAASSQGGFPGIATALAAVTSSVGGAQAAVTPVQPQVTPLEASGGGFKMGQPVYVRIFKKEGVLELWMKRDENYALYKAYPICKWSGELGPKTRQADYQSPEGFYSVSARQLNPNSHYHLAFDLGYPNAYDRRMGSTGNAVMVHGDCKSVGCFAMTNAGIDEIYGIVAAALRNGEHEVPVHIFPFRMTEEALVRETTSPKQFLAFLPTTNAPPPHHDWTRFWRNLKEGYDLFERSHVPPVAYACGDRYEFGAAGRSCSRIAGW